jgi:hypothetical protein
MTAPVSAFLLNLQHTIFGGHDDQMEGGESSELDTMSAAPMLELEGDEPGKNGGRVELPDDRLEVGEAAGKRMHGRNVAKPGRGQRRKAEIEHRIHLGKAASKDGDVR